MKKCFAVLLALLSMIAACTCASAATVKETAFDLTFDEANALNGFGRYDFWDPNVAGVSVESVGSNKVLRLKNYETRTIALSYMLPSGLPDSYRMNIGFKVYMSNVEDWFMLFAAGENAPHRESGAISTKGSLEPADNTQSATPVNILDGNLGYFRQGRWFNDSFANLTTAESNSWYDVFVVLDVAQGQRPTANCTIKKDGAEVASYTEETIGGENCKTVTELQWWFRPTNTEHFVYIDDLKLEYELEANSIEKAEMLKLDGSAVDFEKNPVADINGFKFTLKNKGTVKVELKTKDGTVKTEVEGSDKEYKVLLKEFLIPNEEYTLTVDYKGEEKLEYKFTPVEAENLVLESIEFYKGDRKITALNQLNAGDTVTVKMNVYNFTDSTYPVCLSATAYADGGLKTFNADYISEIPVNFGAATVLKTSFKLPENADYIKAYAWESMQSMKILGECAELSGAEKEMPKKNRVTVNKNTGMANEPYTIDVYAPQKTAGDIDYTAGADNTGVLVYHEQGVTDKNGKISHTFVIANGNGVYNVKTSLTDDFTIKFVDEDEYKTAAEALNEIAEKEDGFDEFSEYIDANSDSLPFDLEKAGSKDKVYKILYNELKKNPLDVNDISKAERVYMQACMADSVRNGEIKNIFDYSEYFVSDITNLSKYTEEDAEGFKIDEEAGKYITKKLNGKTFTDVESFKLEIAKAVVSAAVYNPDGVENLRKVMEDFEYATEVDPEDYTDAALNDIIGKDIDADDLKSALKGAGSSGGSQSGSSSSGKGSSSSKGSASLSGVVYSPSTGNEGVKETVTLGEDIYTDISDVVWAKNAIITLTDLGILSGYGDLTFRPNELVTREQFVKMIAEAFNLESDESEISFDDVHKNDWYYSYVKAAYQNGIVTGYSENRFGVGDNITRQDMCVMAYNMLKKRMDISAAENAEFADSDEIAEYAMEAVATLTANGILNGVGNNEFKPLDNATRAQAAKVVYLLMNLK